MNYCFFIILCIAFFYYRHSPEIMGQTFEQSTITWLLTSICAPHCIRNPYVVAKLVEVLYVTTLNIFNSQSINNMVC